MMFVRAATVICCSFPSSASASWLKSVAHSPLALSCGISLFFFLLTIVLSLCCSLVPPLCTPCQLFVSRACETAERRLHKVGFAGLKKQRPPLPPPPKVQDVVQQPRMNGKGKAVEGDEHNWTCLNPAGIRARAASDADLRGPREG